MTRSPTARQQRFIEEYLIDFNAAQGAIRAGYSRACAKEIGHENLTKPHLACSIEQAKAARARRAGLTAEAQLEDLLYQPALIMTHGSICVDRWS